LKVRKQQKSEAAEGQSTAETPPEQEQEQPPPIESEPQSEPEKETPYQGTVVHQTKNGIDSLCGEEGAMFAVGEELPENSVPCVQCAELVEDEDT